MRHLKTVLDLYRRGDHIPSKELEELRLDMQAIADAAWKYGDLFQLQAAYAQQVADNCRRFLKARAETDEAQR